MRNAEVQSEMQGHLSKWSSDATHCEVSDRSNRGVSASSNGKVFGSASRDWDYERIETGQVVETRSTSVTRTIEHNMILDLWREVNRNPLITDEWSVRVEQGEHQRILARSHVIEDASPSLAIFVASCSVQLQSVLGF